MFDTTNINSTRLCGEQEFTIVNWKCVDKQKLQYDNETVEI